MASNSDQEVFDVVENNKEETDNIDFEELEDDLILIFRVILLVLVVLPILLI